jgi:flavin-dependent dehydrogenase
MAVADVLVVGGGPAGSTCARRLRQGGLRVVVLDRARFPRDKPCAGWITPGVVESLGLDVPEYARSRTLQAFFGFRIGGIGSASVVTDYGRPVSFGIRRSEMDQYLLARCGAPVRQGVPVTRLTRAGGDWTLDGIRAPVVVGAGGHFCPVARHLNPSLSPGPLVVAQEVEFLMDERQRSACRVRPEIPELYFSSDLEGYGWCVRKGDWLNVGLGRRRGEPLGPHVARFVASMISAGRIAPDLPARWRGHAYLLRESPGREVVDDGVLLVGDAAGLAAPASGEGIRPAVESGRLAALTILAARGRRREDLLPYARALEERLGPRAIHRPLPKALTPWVGPLLSVPWFARHVVLDRQFLIGVERPGPPPSGAVGAPA